MMGNDSALLKPWQERTSLIAGSAGMQLLAAARVLVVGVGGVGGHAAEMIARAGVGSMTIVDGDDVAESNINRQMVALHSTVGKLKTDVLAERLRDINPELQLDTHPCYLNPEDMEPLLLDAEGTPKFDYVVDAIDTVSPKMALIVCCLKHKIKIVSSMGAGARMDPSKIVVADISQTHTDGLARAVRSRLKAQHITKGLKVVFSTEVPLPHAVLQADGEEHGKRSTVGSISFLPAAFGCHLAAVVVRGLLASQNNNTHK